MPIRHFTLRSLIACAALAALAALAATSAALAHEFWIEPSKLIAPANAPVHIELKVGHGSDVTVLPRNQERFEKFVIAGPDGERGVMGVDGVAPAGIVRPTSAGVHVVGYRSRPSAVELEAAKFENYLREEGLESVIQRRAETSRSAEPGRERFSRCAKSVITIGDAPHEGFDRSLNMRLELFLERDPRTLAPGENATFRLTYEGKPIANVLVRATAMNQFEHQRSARTDAEGRVSLPLAHSGLWRINAVHMLELSSAASKSPSTGEFDADYESLWASLTFEVLPPPTALPGS